MKDTASLPTKVYKVYNKANNSLVSPATHNTTRNTLSGQIFMTLSMFWMLIFLRDDFTANESNFSVGAAKVLFIFIDSTPLWYPYSKVIGCPFVSVCVS